MSLSERYFSLLRSQWWSVFVQEPSRGKHPRLVRLETSCFDVRYFLIPFFPLIKNPFSTVSTIREHKWENCSKPDQFWKSKWFGFILSNSIKQQLTEESTDWHWKTGKKTFGSNSFELLSVRAQCLRLNTTQAEPMRKSAKLWVRLSSPSRGLIHLVRGTKLTPTRMCHPTPQLLSLCTPKHQLRMTDSVPVSYGIWAGHMH